MNPLASRKRLLIAESELNRAQLVQAWQTMADDVHALAERARTIRSLVSAAASLIAGLMAIGRKKSVPSVDKTSWWQTALKGVGLFGTFWSEFRSHGCQRDE